jgi:hypothetical protein
MRAAVGAPARHLLLIKKKQKKKQQKHEQKKEVTKKHAMESTKATETPNRDIYSL